MPKPKSKNILLLIPNLDFGGAQRSISKLSLELEKHHTVYVAVFNTFDGIAYPHGGELIDLNVSGGSSVIQKISRFRERIKKVKNLKKQLKIDICISFLEGADYINILSKSGEKTIVSIRGSKIHDAEISGTVGEIRKKFLMPYLYKKADKIISVSEGIKNELINYFSLKENKIDTIYNFYEINKITELASESLEEKYLPIFKHPVIINSGRLHIQKAHEALLEAFAISESKNKAKLVIIGNGNLIDHLLKRASELSLNAYWWGQEGEINDSYQVYFIGYQDNPFKFLAKATMFAFSSSWEGFPNALSEAMICGLPVITTDCPTGPREILSPGSDLTIQLTEPEFTKMGILMPLLNATRTQKTIEIWAKEMDSLLHDQARQKLYSENAVQRMMHFTPKEIFKEWEQAVENVS